MHVEVYAGASYLESLVNTYKHGAYVCTVYVPGTDSLPNESMRENVNESSPTKSASLVVGTSLPLSHTNIHTYITDIHTYITYIHTN